MAPLVTRFYLADLLQCTCYRLTDRPFSCPHCPDMFSAKQALEQHILIHKQEKPLKCTFPGCNKSFRQQSARSKNTSSLALKVTLRLIYSSFVRQPCTCVSTPKKGLSNVTFAIERSASPQTWPSIAGRTPPRDPSTAIFQDAKRLSTARISCGDISKPTPRRWPARPASARPVSASARGRPRSRSRSRSRRCSHEAPRRCQIPRLNFP